jgi:hypothetical protein
MYTCFLAVFGILSKYPQFSVEDILIPKIRTVFAMMPDAHKDLAKYILFFLGDVADHEETNLMGPANLATVRYFIFSI